MGQFSPVSGIYDSLLSLPLLLFKYFLRVTQFHVFPFFPLSLSHVYLLFRLLSLLPLLSFIESETGSLMEFIMDGEAPCQSIVCAQE